MRKKIRRSQIFFCVCSSFVCFFCCNLTIYKKEMEFFFQIFLVALVLNTRIKRGITYFIIIIIIYYNDDITLTFIYCNLFFFCGIMYLIEFFFVFFLLFIVYSLELQYADSIIRIVVNVNRRVKC